MTNYKMKELKLVYNGREVAIDYNIYRRTDGFKEFTVHEFTVHEIAYKNRIFRGKNIESALEGLIKLLKRNEK